MRLLLNPGIAVLGLLGFSATAFGQTVTLSLGSGTGAPGGSIALPITIASAGGAQAAAFQLSFGYSTDITSVSVVLGTSGVSAQKTVACNGNLCIVYGLNETIISNGTVATATFQIAANPSTQTIPIQIAGVVVATALGSSISASGVAGAVSAAGQSSTLSGITCALITVITPASTSCTVSLTSAAPAGGVIVPLSSNNGNLAIPPQATVGVGQTSAGVTATATEVSVNQSATITAGSGSATASVTLSLVTPVQLTGVTCPATTLTSGGSSTCTVSLNGVTAVAVTIAIGSNNGIVSVPGSVMVPVGQSGGNFQATAGTVPSSQTAGITASFNGTMQSATINLNIPPVPTVVSVLPSASAGTAQNFTFVFSDSQNVANLSAVAVLFAPSLVYPNSCYIVYTQASGIVQLEYDNMTGNEERLVSSSVPLQNGQCTIGTTTVTTTALSLTINVAITFSGTFGGLKNIYMYGADSTGTINTGWVQKGTYTVTVGAPVPSAVSVSPSANAGTAQTFTFVFSDNESAANLSAAAILFATSPSAYPNSCYIVYTAASGTIQLEWDNMTGATERSLASSQILQNSQCMVGAATVTSSALTNTITLAVTFSGAFSGLKNIYMYGADGNGTINTGWVQMGTFTVTTVSAPVPSVVSVSPSGSGGAVQTFAFVFADSENVANLSAVAMLFSSSLVYPNSCFIVYDQNLGTVQLEWDNMNGATERPVGSTAPLQNSQCMIGATTVTTTALSLTVNVAITFEEPFSGLKNIYMYGADTDGSINTGWVDQGTWTPF